MVIAHEVVLRAPAPDAGQVVREQALQEGEAAFAGHIEATHVRNVEEPSDLAHRNVLLANGRVLLGQLPAAEVHNASTEGDVTFEEWSSARRASRQVQSARRRLRGRYLFVVSAARIGDYLGDIESPIHSPFQLLSELWCRRRAMQDPRQDQLGALVVGGRGHEQLTLADSRGLARQRGVDLSGDAGLGVTGEVRLSAVGKRAHGVEQADRALLDQVDQGQCLLASCSGKTYDAVNVAGHQPVLAGAVAQRRPLEQHFLLALRERPSQSGLARQRLEGVVVIAAIVARVQLRVGKRCHTLDFTTPPKTVFPGSRPGQCSTFYTAGKAGA